MARWGDGDGVGALSRRQLLTTAALGSGALVLGGLRPVLGQSASEPFRFGLIKALTGRAASAYAPFYVGPRIAVDEINAAGGILGRKVEIVDADDEGVPTKDPSLVKSLQESKIDILLGPMGTGNSLSALSVTTPERLIAAMGSWGSDVSDPKTYPYHFSFVYNDRVASAMTVDFVTKRLPGKKVAIIQDSFPYSAAVTKSASAGFADKGLPVTGVEVFPNNTPDVKSNMRALQRTGADVLVLAITLPTNVALVFNALRGIGWYPTMLGYSALMSDALLDMLPAEALERVYTTYSKAFSYTDAEKPAAMQVAHVEKLLKYPETKGQEANAAICPFYDAAHVFKWAIERAQSTDSDKLKVTLESLTAYPGMVGTLNITPENHCAVGPDAMAWCKISSARDPRANGAFRERLVG